MNRTLLVLGASSDVGISLVKNSYMEYDKVVAHYRTESKELCALKELLEGKLELIQADFSSEEDTDRFVSQISVIPTHIVHLPAPKLCNERFHKIKWDKYQENFDIQFRAIVKTLSRFMPNMAKNKYGKIVMLISSVSQGNPPKYMADYVATKYALLGFMRALAAEYATKGICINGISPSMMETKLLSNVPELIVEQNKQLAPMGKLAQVSDVVSMIEYLLSDKADYITGQNIVVSGGLNI